MKYIVGGVLVITLLALLPLATVLNNSDSGSYTVDSNCTGSITFDNGPDAGQSYAISTVSSGLPQLRFPLPI